MSFPLVMSGHERTYRPPRSLRAVIGDEVTAWDLFRLEHDEIAGQWAAATLASVVAAVEAESAELLGCSDCADTGFYGISSPDDPDLLVTLLRRVGDDAYETLTAAGEWVPESVRVPAEVLDLSTAADLASAVTSECSGLLRLYGPPRAFLPPADTTTARSLISPEGSGFPQTLSGESWTTFAIVAAGDPGAVLDLVRFRADESERWEEGTGWTPDGDIGETSVPMVELTARQLEDVLAQMQPSLAAGGVLREGGAERLRTYWTRGKGALKIRWNTPGDFTRCYRHLRKYMGVRAHGYCAIRHKVATGFWPGSRFNVGGNGRRGRLLSSGSPETTLLASIRSRRMTGNTEGTTDMPTTMLTDGVYTEVDDITDELLQNLAASAIPVSPPDDWFDDPKLTKPTTLSVTAEGRVFGHLAPWGVTHIGMAGSVPAPKNRSGNYSFFRTGQIVTASGKSVRVGQLTLVGGHASRTASAEEAVKHYDDTQSGVADIAVGEDKHGIWAAGALRPGVTPEQIRVMRASPPSGDWRRINGNLELVAACHVNTQGFPIAEAMVAGGAITALVAAGARQMAELRITELADVTVLSRLTELEAMVASLVASDQAIVELPGGEPATGVLPTATEGTPDPAEDNPAAAETQEVDEPDPTPEELDRAAKISRAREQIAAARRQALRDRVAATTAAGMPPQFAAHVKGKDGNKAKSTIKGTDSFPIGNVADLKKAIQAFGRAGDKDAAKKHIISQAYKLKRPDLIPSNWRSSK
jgi:hypothetical protein